MNYLSGKHLSRRTFLRGVGAALALPALDAMVPAASAAPVAESAAPTRMAIIYLPNGVIMEHWTPIGGTGDLVLSPSLSPLERHRSQLNVLTGLAQLNGRALGDGAGDHARAAATFLTGVHPKKTAGADIRSGVSVDQVAAEFVGAKTRLPSLELTLEQGRLAGSCDSGYSCAYSNSISWRTEHTPNPPEHDPREVFDRLFGSYDPTLTAEERATRRLYRRSMLDVVADDTRKLMRELGNNDRRKLDEYLYAVRKLEQRVQSAENLESLQTTDFPVPEERPSDFVEYVRLMFDLQVLAFRTDQTRIITFMVGHEGSNRRHKEIGVDGAHHELSHHRGDDEKIDQLAQINQHHIDQVAYFLDQLKSVEEYGGTLLDHSMVLCGSGLSDGNRHQHHDLPLILAGGANGTIRGGRHLKYEENVPMNNLFLSMLDRMGAHTEQLGDSTGRLEHLAEL